MHETLITGSSGFIGSWFREVFGRQGARCSGLDITPPAKGSTERFVQGDVRDAKAVLSSMEGATRVLHLAAAHHDFGIDRETYFGVNVRGSEVLCEAMDRAGVRDVCFYSSVAVYGDGKGPHHEGVTPCPSSPYGESKLAAEEVFRRWVGTGGGRRCLIVRPTVTFGPGNWANMYSLIRQIDKGRFLRVGREDNVKGLAYVENIVEATLRLWDREDRPDFETYNYVDKPDLVSGCIVKAVYQGLGKRVPQFRWPFWVARLLAIPFDAVIGLTGKNLAVSSERLRKLYVSNTSFEAAKVHSVLGSKLGQGQEWVPIELEEGIRRMVKWYEAEGRHGTRYRSVPGREVRELCVER